MRALGLIETRGLVGAIEASDAAVKAADAVLTQLEYVDFGMVTVKLRGDVADVQAAVDAGASAARRIGEVVTAHVIPNPHEDVEVLIHHHPVMTSTGWDARGGNSQDNAVNSEDPLKKKPSKKK